MHWGIGHATRSIPIIKQLIEQSFEPVLASDGAALAVLQKAFPKLTSYELPSYNVQYAKNKNFFSLKLFFQIPKFIKTYKFEKQKTKEIVEKENIVGIISDNRFGVFYNGIPNIYITHQIRVKSGISTFFTSLFHQKIINKYDVCWVPDSVDSPNLSGDLSHNVNLKIPIKYIGILSQFKRSILIQKYDVLVLLSGPEPQRSLLEDKLLNAFENTKKKVCFIRGVVAGKSEKTQQGNISIYNYLLGSTLQEKLNQSDLIIARSGYSTIMDLAVLQKKAFFIPTPGQAEQIYLAKHLESQKIAPFALQGEFSADLLAQINTYNGFSNSLFTLKA